MGFKQSLMHTWRILAALVFLFAATMAAPGAEAAAPEGLPPAAPVFHVGPLQFTSSMIVTWIVAVFLIVVAQLATRKIQLVPQGLQNFVEWLVEGLYGFFGEILGPALVKKSFWFFCTIFLFILATNWIGLIPGVGTIGYGEVHDGHFHASHPFLRGGNADLNMTLAMALVFFFLWTVWSFQTLVTAFSTARVDKRVTVPTVLVVKGSGTSRMGDQQQSIELGARQHPAADLKQSGAEAEGGAQVFPGVSRPELQIRQRALRRLRRFHRKAKSFEYSRNGHFPAAELR